MTKKAFEATEMLKTVEKTTADRFRRELKTKILRGELHPGEALLPERQLTAKVGLSLARIRSALAGLAMEGLIVRTQGRGSFVADPLPKHAETQTIQIINCHTYGDSVYWLAVNILHGLTERCESLSLRPLLHQIASSGADTIESDHNALIDELDDAIGVAFLPMPEALASRWRIVPEVLWNMGVPCVKVAWPDAHLLASRQVPAINFDRRLMARMAAEHAVSAGYKRLAYISPNVHRHNEESRLAGFIDAVMANRLPIHEDYIVESAQDLETIREAVGRLMKCEPRPEVICCGTDVISGLVARVLTEMGLKIPADIALVGCLGGGRSGSFSPINITRAVPPSIECGRKAAELLRSLIDGKPAPKRTLVVEPEFIVADSCPAVRVPNARR